MPNMYKYKIVLEYDGTNYSGWQTQKNVKSIPGTLITAAQNFLTCPWKFRARTHRCRSPRFRAGRPSGVWKKLNLQTFRIGLNDNLPVSINVLLVENAPLRFHARHHAVSRSYLYPIAKRRTAFGKRYVWWIKDNLNLSKMQQALTLFQGFHDFASFADKGMDKDASTKVNIEGIHLEEFDDIIALRVVGSHFPLEDGAPYRGNYRRGWSW